MRGLLVLVVACSYEPHAAQPGHTGDDTPDAAQPPMIDAPAPPGDIGQINNNCPMRYDIAFGTHFYFATGLHTWDGARGDCATDGGHLIKLDDDAEAAQLASQLGGLPEAWIGLRDQGAGYKWHDGTLPVIDHWSPQDPTSNDPDCSVERNDASWRPANCSDGNFVALRIGVCECDNL